MRNNFKLRDSMDISSLDVQFVDGHSGFEKFAEYDAREFIRLADAQGLTDTGNVKRDGVEEDTLALYAQLNAGWDIGSMPLKASLGLRSESTDITAISLANSITGFYYVTDSQLDRTHTKEPGLLENTGSYSEILPNLDLQLELSDSLVARFSHSHTIARSSLGALYPGEVRITDARPATPFTAIQGNPNLKPYKSKNIDLSLEWYYSEGSYISAGYFDKTVDNFIGTRVTVEDMMSPNGAVTNPSVNPRPGCPAIGNEDCYSSDADPVAKVEVSRSVNQRETEVNGLEFNIQHLLGESGFGVILNYTKVNGKDKFDPDRLDNDFALQGLSDSANLQAFYDKNNLQARIAYNWRDEFYAGAKGTEPVEPRFTSAYGQIDANVSYGVNDNLSVFIEGINLTNEPTRVHGRWSNQVKAYETYGTRYNVGASYAF